MVKHIWLRLPEIGNGGVVLGTTVIDLSETLRRLSDKEKEKGVKLKGIEIDTISEDVMEYYEDGTEDGSMLVEEMDVFAYDTRGCSASNEESRIEVKRVVTISNIFDLDPPVVIKVTKEGGRYRGRIDGSDVTYVSDTYMGVIIELNKLLENIMSKIKCDGGDG